MFRDEETLKTAIEAAIVLGATSARDAAKRTMRREITDEEWAKAGLRWEKAWREAHASATLSSTLKSGGA